MHYQTKTAFNRPKNIHFIVKQRYLDFPKGFGGLVGRVIGDTEDNKYKSHDYKTDYRNFEKPLATRVKRPSKTDP